MGRLFYAFSAPSLTLTQLLQTAHNYPVRMAKAV
jgi:hypothetical protein